MDRDRIRNLREALLQAKVNGDQAAQDAAQAELAPLMVEAGKRTMARMTAKAVANTGNDNA